MKNYQFFTFWWFKSLYLCIIQHELALRFSERFLIQWKFFYIWVFQKECALHQNGFFMLVTHHAAFGNINFTTDYSSVIDFLSDVVMWCY